MGMHQYPSKPFEVGHPNIAQEVFRKDRGDSLQWTSEKTFP